MYHFSQTSDNVRYLIGHNFLRNGTPYTSTNGPQGDFVFDQAENGECYLTTRADESGLEQFVLKVPTDDANKINNFVGQGRID